MNAFGKMRDFLSGAASWPPLRVSVTIASWGLIASVPIVSAFLLWGSAGRRDDRIWFPNDPQHSVDDKKKGEHDSDKAGDKERDASKTLEKVPGNRGLIEGLVLNPSAKSISGCRIFFVPFNGVWNPEPVLLVKDGVLAMQDIASGVSGLPGFGWPHGGNSSSGSLPRAESRSSPSPSVASLVSEKDGAFKTELPPCAFKVYAWSQGFAPACKGAVIRPGVLLKELKIRLEEGAWLEGSVRTSTDMAPEDIELVALTPAVPFRFIIHPANDGSFRFEHLPGGPYTLLLFNKGKFISLVENVISGSQGVKIDMPKADAGTIRASDTEGKNPIGKSAFRIAIPNIPEDAFSLPVKSDDDGRIELPALPAGNYLIRSENPAFADLYYPFRLISDGRVNPEDLRFNAGRKVKGHVHAQDTGEPLSDAMVCWEPSNRAGKLLGSIVQNIGGAVIRRWTATDAGGRFCFDRVPAYPSFFLVVHPDYATTRFVSIGPSTEKGKEGEKPSEPLVIQLSKGGRISGKALCKFEPLVVYDEEGFFRITFPDGNGNFNLTGVNPGFSYLTSLCALKGMERHPVTGFILDNEMSSQLEFNDKMYGLSPSLEGNLIYGGLPVQDAEIFLLYPWDRTARFAQKAEMKEGRYIYKTVRPGKYTLEVRRRGDTYRKYIEVKDKVGHLVADISLPRGEINIEVRSEGCSLAGRSVEVVLYHIPPGSPAWAIHSTARFKDFEAKAFGAFKYLDPGKYMLVGQGNELAPEVNDEIEVSHNNYGFSAIFSLGMGVKVEAEILDDKGKPIPGASLHAFTAGGKERRLINPIAGEDGKVSLLLKQGTYTFRAEARGFSPGEAGPLNLVRGNAAALRVLLAPEHGPAPGEEKDERR